MLKAALIIGRNLDVSGRRLFSSLQLYYEEFGDPMKVLKLRKIEKSNELRQSQVRVEWIGSPVNPADINQIQGVYPVRPELPAVAGNEGFGRIRDVGASVENFSSGDHVIALSPAIGSWQTECVCEKEDLLRIDKRLSVEASATIKVNPPTAFRMLKDFVDLQPGDLVIQNGANSAVGRAVIQICKFLKLRTVNVVRWRENLDELLNELKSLGADDVYTEEQLLKNKQKLKNARLALNCVGGRSALILASSLDKNGVMVTYGGMSRQPLQVSTGSFIFNDIVLRGFWMTEWYGRLKNREKIQPMFEELTSMILRNELVPSNVETVKFEDWKLAIESSLTSSGKKQIFTF